MQSIFQENWMALLRQTLNLKILKRELSTVLLTMTLILFIGTLFTINAYQ